ncbi:P-type conjugative transfer protein TrbL [Delftia lacustris]|uniref:P-type conjugative transfer protein TrbL n=1 Tax=Delftia lacustris TaxID=558537 RepID=UPI0035A64001
MNDVTVIDRFLDTFSRYIDSGFGLLQGEVAFLTATLIAIDMTLAGLYWAMSHATGQGEDVLAKLLRKVLYVGAFAYIIGNFNGLAGIVFRSFAGLGLTATGSAMSLASFLQPGRIAKTGLDAAAPIMAQIGDMAGFPEVFLNIDAIAVMFLAWFVVVLSFFVLAIQLFVTLIEFKLTTLAGFVLVPFALWNKTSFLAEKVLGNVVSSGIKVLVLAVIVGIGSGLFAEFQVQPSEPSIDHAMVIMLASLSLLALGIFGPGIATGLVSGAPQLGAGAMAGATLGVAGTVAGMGAMAAGVGSAVMAGARMGSAAKTAGSGTQAVPSAAMGPTPRVPPAGGPAGGSPPPTAGPGSGGGICATHGGRSAVSQSWAVGASASGTGTGARAGAGAGGGAGAPAANGSVGGGVASAPGGTAPGAATAAAAGRARASIPAAADDAPPQEQPAWAKRLQRRQQISQAATTAAHTLRGGDGGGSGQGPSLRDPDA